ncbi:antigen-presenting glycoprotein CD1d-like [Rhinophrynus dorsalis]
MDKRRESVNMAVTGTFLLCLLVSGVSTEHSDALTLTLQQSSVFSEDMTMTLWATGEMGDIELYSLNNQKLTFKQSWSRGDMHEFWIIAEEMLKRYFGVFEKKIKEFVAEVGQRPPITVQCDAGCIAGTDEPGDNFFQIALNGVDLIYLDFSIAKWVAGHHPNSSYAEKVMNEDIQATGDIISALHIFCKMLANNLATSERKEFEKKVKPQVYFSSHNKVSVIELMCMATGFFPKPINVSLWKDEEHQMKDILSTMTLPNGDGTYQIRVFGSKALEDKDEVYCRVEHSSLEKPLMVPLGEHHPTHVGVIVGTALCFLLLTGTVLFVMIYRKRRAYRSVAGSNVAGRLP